MNENNNLKSPCGHLWISADYILTSNPPQTPQICSMCGERRTQTGTLNLMVKYDDIMRKFHGDK